MPAGYQEECLSMIPLITEVFPKTEVLSETEEAYPETEEDGIGFLEPAWNLPSTSSLLTPPRSPLCEAAEELGLLKQGLKNDVLHDCMWSGQCTHVCKQKTAVCRPRFKSVSDEGCCNPSAVCDPVPVSVPTDDDDDDKEDDPVPWSRSKERYALYEKYTPLSDHCYHQQSQPRNDDTPVIVVSDTPSDSDSEIDVVNVKARQSDEAWEGSSNSGEERVECVRHFSERRVPLLKVSSRSKASSIIIRRRTYIRAKRFRRSLGCSKWCSDSEDTGRRSQHNIMERKRRGEMRASFQTLRSLLPELRDNSRAAKVRILEAAKQQIKQLQDVETDMEAIIIRETQRKSQLERRLRELRKK